MITRHVGRDTLRLSLAALLVDRSAPVMLTAGNDAIPERTDHARTVCAEHDVAEAEKGQSPTCHAPATLVMPVRFLSLGLFAILRPEKLIAAIDNLANAWRQGSWHLYRMPISVLRLVIGSVGIDVAGLFMYIAYVGLRR